MTRLPGSHRGETGSALQCHLVSYEGFDDYARVGGLATRVEGLAETLTAAGIAVHLWFLGDPQLPSDERRGRLTLHRRLQRLSAKHSDVYAGEHETWPVFTREIPPELVRGHLVPHLRRGGRAAILAEEWQTADAVLHMDWLLRYEGLRDRVRILWNANNTFGFERIHWRRLDEAARIMTVSSYMRDAIRHRGVEAWVMPNGLPSDAFLAPDPAAVASLQTHSSSRALLSKVARFDPSKNWSGAIAIVARMKKLGWRPLLVARGGGEAFGTELLASAGQAGLRVADRWQLEPGGLGLVEALCDTEALDVVSLRSRLDPEGSRTLFRASDAVLANSSHEPFGLVALEAMAAEGLVCTGRSGEDYAVPDQNALVMQTQDPAEFLWRFRHLRSHPNQERALRRAAQKTARSYLWTDIVRRSLLPKLGLSVC